MPHDDPLSKMQQDDAALGSDELIAAYEKGIGDLNAAVAGMTREQMLARPIAGKWSAQECVSHLADTEILYADRIIRTLVLDRPLLIGVDERCYMARLSYQDFDLDEQLALFAAVRRHVARILKAQAPEEWRRTAVHSESGLVSLRQLIMHPIRHLSHHLPFIAEKRAALGQTMP